MEYINYSDYENMLDTDVTYWNGRWNYYKEVIEILNNEEITSALELGPYNISIVKNGDVMDKIEYLENIKYVWDATRTPWPVEDKKYDIFIALQVWEHLEDKQKECFSEVIRVSKSVILSFPLNWYCPGDCHHGITQETIKEWTLEYEPVKILEVGTRIIYHFKFD